MSFMCIEKERHSPFMPAPIPVARTRSAILPTASISSNTRAAAPIELASSPLADGTIGGRFTIVVKARLCTVFRTSSNRMSPARATPPPITRICFLVCVDGLSAFKYFRQFGATDEFPTRSCIFHGRIIGNAHFVE